MKVKYILELCNLKDSYTKKNNICNIRVYFILNLLIKTQQKKVTMKYLNTIYLILGMILSSAIHSIDITNKMKSHISSYP